MRDKRLKMLLNFVYGKIGANHVIESIAPFLEYSDPRQEHELIELVKSLNRKQREYVYGSIIGMLKKMELKYPIITHYE